MSSKAPRVLVSGVVFSQPLGGVRRHNAELLPRAARLLAARGGRLAVMAGRDGLPFELPPEVEVHASHVPSRPPIARALHEGRALARLVGPGAFDLVHTAHLPAPRGLGVPFTLTLHDLRSLWLSHTPFSRRLVARSVIGDAVRRARAVCLVSRTLETALRSAFGIRHTFVVPNGCNHLSVLARRAGAGAPLVHVGHLEPRKNLELLLAALAHDPGLPPLELAGAAKGDERERLEERARELGVSARVRFLGPIDDDALAALYARAGAAVFPSKLEGFGIPVLEAQRARVPVAVAEAGALPEVAGEDASRFAPDDAAACARAIRSALQAPPAALERAAARAAGFGWDRSAALLVEGWERALGTSA
jgi:glycosyltransferase involved in cell wall biosynthesis